MPTDQAAAHGSPFAMLPFFLIILVFYFLVFKPQKDEQKKRKEMMTNLKKNDEVITSGGIHGTVLNIKDTTLVVRIDDNVKIEVDKDAITNVKS